MQLTGSAHKHSVEPEDTLHAWNHAIYLSEQDYDSEIRLFVIGPARDGSLLELVAVEADQPSRIIHSAPLRPKFYPLIPHR